MPDLVAPDYQIARFLIERGLATIYLIGFVVAAIQFPALCGERGLQPAPRLLQVVPFRRAPSLFHWRYSDRIVAIVSWLVGLTLHGLPILATDLEPGESFLKSVVHADGNALSLGLAAAVIWTVVAGYLIDATLFSLHAMYANRLVRGPDHVRTHVSSLRPESWRISAWEPGPWPTTAAALP